MCCKTEIADGMRLMKSRILPRSRCGAGSGVFVAQCVGLEAHLPIKRTRCIKFSLYPDGFIKKDFGTSLREMQCGRAAKLQIRPMQSIGAAVFELKHADKRIWYRMVYLAHIEDTIYALDCFAPPPTNPLQSRRSQDNFCLRLHGTSFYEHENLKKKIFREWIQAIWWP